MSGMTAEPGHYYVAKDDVPYALWNRLVGEVKPARRAGGPAEGTEGTATDL